MYEIYCPESAYPFAANTYVLSSLGEAVVIDPAVPKSTVDKYGLKIKYVLLTHGHFDHFLELDSYTDNGIELLVSEECNRAIRDAELNCYRRFFGRETVYSGEATLIGEGETVEFGDTQITAIATPGHSAGSTSFVLPDAVIVGDVCFAGGGIGRYDLPTADYPSLQQSIQRICALPPSYKVYPGHGESTTVEKLKRELNIYF